MPVELEGGCIVTGLRDGKPLSEGCLETWSHFGRSSGARAISLRVLQVSPGTSPGLRNEEAEEVLFVLEGRGRVFLDGHVHEVAPGSGIYLRPGVCLTIENPGPSRLTLASSRCPDPVDAQVYMPACTVPASKLVPQASPVVRVQDREDQSTAHRSHRVLVDSSVGCKKVLQFVGTVPPGPAPDHYHRYEEVLVVLTGQGFIWASGSRAPIEVGSCIYLPRGQVHHVENTGNEGLEVLGTAYPSGSPSHLHAD